MKELPDAAWISRWNSEIDIKAFAPHLLLSGANPKLAFSLSPSFSQSSVPQVKLLPTSKQRASFQPLFFSFFLPDAIWNVEISKTASGRTFPSQAVRYSATARLCRRVFIKVRLWIEELSSLKVYRVQTSRKLSTWTREQKKKIIKNGFAYDKRNLKTAGLFKASSVSFFIPGGNVGYGVRCCCTNEFNSKAVFVFQRGFLCNAAPKGPYLQNFR